MAFRKIPRRILLRGDQVAAAAHIGLADKFTNIVEDEARLRGLSQFSGAREIAAGVMVTASVMFGQTTMQITATMPRVNKELADQFRKFMCLCSSCFTLGIVESVTKPIAQDGHQYSSDNRYTVLVCTTDKPTSGADQARYKPHATIKRLPGILAVSGVSDFYRLVPAQSSDGAVYEVGELVVLIPHPFGIDLLDQYSNAPFLAAGEVPADVAGPDKGGLAGGCSISDLYGALIVPIEIKGIAEYYFQNESGKFEPVPSNPTILDAPDASAKVSHEVLEIDVTDHAIPDQRYGDLEFVQNILSSYSVEYATIEDFVWEPYTSIGGRARVRFVSVTKGSYPGLGYNAEKIIIEEKGGSAIVQTISNHDSVDGSSPIGFEESYSLYTIAPVPNQYALVELNDNVFSRGKYSFVTNDDVIAVVLRCSDPDHLDHNAVLCLLKRYRKVNEYPTALMALRETPGVFPQEDKVASTIKKFPAQREHICFPASPKIPDDSNNVFIPAASKVGYCHELLNRLQYRIAPETRDDPHWLDLEDQDKLLVSRDHSLWGWEWSMYQDQWDYYEQQGWIYVDSWDYWKRYRMPYPQYPGGPDGWQLITFAGGSGQGVSFKWADWVNPSIGTLSTSFTSGNKWAKTMISDGVANPAYPYLPSINMQQARISLFVGQEFIPTINAFHPFSGYAANKQIIVGLSYSFSADAQMINGNMITNFLIKFRAYGVEADEIQIGATQVFNDRHIGITQKVLNDQVHYVGMEVLYISGTRPQVVAGNGARFTFVQGKRIEGQYGDYTYQEEVVVDASQFADTIFWNITKDMNADWNTIFNFEYESDDVAETPAILLRPDPDRRELSIMHESGGYYAYLCESRKIKINAQSAMSPPPADDGAPPLDGGTPPIQ